MGRNVVETLMGAVVLLVAAVFLLISYRSGNINTSPDGYKVTAKFRQIGSLAVGSDVRVGGIKVGTVSAQSLDPKSYMAILELSVRNDIKLPTDSSAAIVGDGLMGGKYVAIEPGADESFLGNGGQVKFTQDSISIEELIGKFAFGSVGKDKDGASSEKKADDL